MEICLNQYLYIVEDCCTCGAPVLLTPSQRNVLLNNHNSFYCPSGHSMSFLGKTEAEKEREQNALLQREIQDLKSKVAQRDNRGRYLKRS